MKQSNFLSLAWRDYGRALVMAILTPVFFVINQSIESGVFTMDWNALKLAALSGLFGYLTKNFFTKPDKVEVIESDLEPQGIIGTPNVPKSK